MIWSGATLTLYAITREELCGVEQWLSDLDDQAQAAFRARFEHLTDIGRLRAPDAWRHLDGGVFEIKIHVGPGYRLYVLRDGQDWIATHGSKKPKVRKVSAEIKKAKEAFAEYQSPSGEV